MKDNNDRMNIQSQRGYFKAVREWIYSLIFIIPLAIIYEISSLVANRSIITGIRSAAEVWILKVLYTFGFPTFIPLSIIFIIVFGFIYLIKRRKGFKMRWHYTIFMLIEALILGALLGIVVSFFMRILPLSFNAIHNISLSFGAGLYEELIFRALLLPALAFIFIKLKLKKIVSWSLAIIISSILFSVMHHLGAFGEPFRIDAFIYRFLSGCFFSVLYLLRGFGITAWSHSIYDLLVFGGFYSIF
ncbi:MAG: CPBP family intramembrane glutamic endopeptidase [bacterium]